MPLSDNFVSDYDFMNKCAWPVFEDTLIKQLPLIFGLSSLPLFHANYTKLGKFLQLSRLQHTLNIESQFNLTSYAQLLGLEMKETTDQLEQKPNSMEATLKLCLQVLQEFYLPEVGA